MRWRVIAAAAIVTMSGLAWSGFPGFAQSPQDFKPGNEEPGDFPAGIGREETFYTCTACHNFKLVAAQGMNRRQWEESMDLMVRRHGMNPLPDEDRKRILDYLEATFPPRGSGGGWQNPFLSK